MCNNAQAATNGDVLYSSVSCLLVATKKSLVFPGWSTSCTAAATNKDIISNGIKEPCAL